MYKKWIREPSASHQGWKTEWKIKDLLTDEENGLAVSRIAKEIHLRLEDYRLNSFYGEWKNNDEIHQVSDEFHTIGFVDGKDANVRYFNSIMDLLYDFADFERVIIS